MNTNHTAGAKTMLFKDQVKTLTDSALEDFVSEWRILEHRAHAMRDSRGARNSRIALACAWKEQDRRKRDA